MKADILGSVYFTANMILAATDRLEPLCRQSNNIRSRGMKQFE